MTEWRSTEEVLEVLGDDPRLRVSSYPLEVLAEGAVLRVSEYPLEVMAHNPDSDPYDAGAEEGRKVISPVLTTSPTQIT